MAISSSQFKQPIVSALTPQIRCGLMQLLHAFDCASDLGCSCWDFSVEIERLLAVGMTTSDLRWLIKRGCLSHAREVTGPNDLERRFDPQYHSLAFSETTCFVLTASGLAILGASFRRRNACRWCRHACPTAAASPRVRRQGPRKNRLLRCISHCFDLPRDRFGVQRQCPSGTMTRGRSWLANTW